jgi:hypothetical protein
VPRADAAFAAALGSDLREERQGRLIAVGGVIQAMDLPEHALVDLLVERRRDRLVRQAHQHRHRRVAPLQLEQRVGGEQAGRPVLGIERGGLGSGGQRALDLASLPGLEGLGVADLGELRGELVGAGNGR